MRWRAIVAALVGLAVGSAAELPRATPASPASAVVPTPTSSPTPDPNPSPPRRIAVTVDDLPALARGDHSLRTHRWITDALLASFTRHEVPAVGFVNEDKLAPTGEVEPERVDLLREWLEAGMELGNHTWSHPDLHRVDVRSFQADVLKGERVLRELLDAETTLWFRHPFLHNGRDSTVRARMDAFFAAHRYRVAPITIDHSDYVFSAALDAAVEDGRPTVPLVEAYLAYMREVILYYEQQSRALFGREIDQVLLLHANRLNALAFDELAAWLDGRGYDFVPLAEALEDPAYASEDRYYGPAGITWLHRWALTAGHRGEFFAGEPEVPAWVVEASGLGR